MAKKDPQNWKKWKKSSLSQAQNRQNSVHFAAIFDFGVSLRLQTPESSDRGVRTGPGRVQVVGRPTAHFLTPSLHWLLTKREPGFPGASSQDHRESCCLLKGSPHTRPEFVLRVWDGGVSLPSPFMFPGLGRACFAHMRSVPWPRRKKKVGSLRLAKAAAGFGAVEEVRVSAGARGEVREMLEEARRSSCPGAQTRWLPKQSEGGGGEGGPTWVRIGLQCWGVAPRRLAHAQPFTP